MATKLEDLIMSVEFADITLAGNQAFIHRHTGDMYWSGDSVDEPLPGDIEDGTTYIAIPGKSELGLGRSLALRFTSEHLPDALDEVYQYFRRRAAYSRFKDLLAENDLLESWYRYEEDATREAVLAWCEENNIDVDQ